MSPAGGAFVEEVPPAPARAIPIVSVMAGSVVTTIPFVATFPVLPPCGLMVLIAWRLARPETMRIWAPVPFGLFDDLVSGQPLGSAMLLWTLAFVGIDLLDQRLVGRDFWQDWVLAAGAIALTLIGGRLVATPLGAHVDGLVLCQGAVAILLYPLVARLVALLDRKRGRA